MKKNLLAIFSCLFLFFTSCNNDTGGSKLSAQAQKNLDACHTINKAVETGEVSPLDNIIAADAIDHTSMGECKGRDSIKAELAKIHTMGTDMKAETLKEFADDDYVFQWVRYTGTTATSDMGMPAGTKYDWSTVHVTKFKDGMATEHWEFMQAADMMKMMPQPGSEHMMMDDKMKDTTKKM